MHRQPKWQLLKMAARFAQPEGDAGDAGKDGGKPAGKEGGEKGGGGGDGGEGGDGGDEEKPIPYARFKEVNSAKRNAEAELRTAQSEVTRLTKQVEQLQSTDQAGALKTAQEQVTTLQKQIEAIDGEFEDMLEVALADLPKEQATMVREIPGGARAQFAWFNKHRTRLVGTSSNGEAESGTKGPKGSQHDRKPEGGKKAEPSGAAKQYVEATKPREKGFAGLA